MPVKVMGLRQSPLISILYDFKCYRLAYLARLVTDVRVTHTAPGGALAARSFRRYNTHILINLRNNINSYLLCTYGVIFWCIVLYSNIYIVIVDRFDHMFKSIRKLLFV